MFSTWICKILPNIAESEKNSAQLLIESNTTKSLIGLKKASMFYSSKTSPESNVQAIPNQFSKFHNISNSSKHFGNSGIFFYEAVFEITPLRSIRNFWSKKNLPASFI